jgi:hypothetical protein
MLSPSHGMQVKYSFDFPGAPNGVIEYIVTHAILQSIEVPTVLGITPWADLGEVHLRALAVRQPVADVDPSRNQAASDGEIARKLRRAESEGIKLVSMNQDAQTTPFLSRA